MKASVLISCFLFSSVIGLKAQDEVKFYMGTEEHTLTALRYVKPPYVHLFQFLKAMGGEPVEEDGTIHVVLNRRQMEMDVARGIAKFNRVQHSFPIRRKEGSYYVRVDVIVKVFSDFMGRRMVYEPTSKSLHLPLARDLMVTVRTRAVADGYRVVLIYSDSVQRPTLKVTDRNMVLKIKEKNVAIDRTGFIPNAAVEKMQVFPNLPDGSTEILFVITKETKKWDREPFNPENPRTIIKLSGDYENAVTGIMDRINTNEGRLKRIVIDPGHGGRDKGAVGPGGLQEKDVTLELALKLKTALATHFEVLLTREEDVLLPLKTRTAIANNFEADLFLSIHVNAINLPGATGSETYYLSLDAESPDQPHYNDFEADEKESGPSLPNSDDLALILWDMAQTKYAEDSFRVAKHVQDSLNVISGIRNRGVKQASLKVLKGATMPAVLVEVAFISNAKEERRLKTDEFRDKIVDAMVRAIDAYDKDLQTKGRDADTEDNSIIGKDSDAEKEF